MSKHIIVSDLDIAYERAGKGQPLLMVHGWGSNMQTFDQLAAELSVHFDIIRLDLPGFGGSQTPGRAWRLDDYAVFIDEFLQKLGVDHLFCLLGHSLGGRIAIRAQATGHVLSDKLVLLASHGIASPRSPRLLFFKTLSKLGKILTSWLPSEAQAKLKARLYKQAGSTDYLNTAPAMKQTFKNVINQDLRQDARKVITDTLLIYGTKDDMTPARYGQVFASAMPHSRLALVESAQHYVHLDAPERVRQLIEDFL